MENKLDGLKRLETAKRIMLHKQQSKSYFKPNLLFLQLLFYSLAIHIGRVRFHPIKDSP